MVSEDSLGASLSTASEVTSRAQPYFQNKWNGADVALSEALVYTMRVSKTGEIAEFEAQSEVAEGISRSLAA